MPYHKPSERERVHIFPTKLPVEQRIPADVDTEVKSFGLISREFDSPENTVGDLTDLVMRRGVL